MTPPFVKRRDPARPGSIPDVLQMWVSEVRFYREIAPVVGVRVPQCYLAEESGGATLLHLEDLSGWRLGADPADAARTLATLHERWQGEAAARWPWLRRPGAAVDLVGALYDETWPALAARADLRLATRSLGERLVGCVAEAEADLATAGAATLVHGDASSQNMRTSASGEVALLDWEDVGAAPGVADLAWLLVSSVEPEQWDAAVDAYGHDRAERVDHALPAAAVQGFLTLDGHDEGSEQAAGWVARLEETARRLA